MSTPERTTLAQRMALARQRTAEARGWAATAPQVWSTPATAPQPWSGAAPTRPQPLDTWPAALEGPAAPVAAARRLEAARPAWQLAATPGQQVVLLPGQLYFGDQAASLRTLLGSCVAVILWHPQRRLGGMCHFLLPTRNRRVHDAPDGRYGDEAIATLMDCIGRAGTRPSDYQAHLYGGADTLPDSMGRHFNIGERNIELGWRLMDLHGFQLQGVDVGEDIPRAVALDMITGEVDMRRCAGRAPSIDTQAAAASRARR